MTIIEAIKSGKRFRSRSWLAAVRWADASPHGGIVFTVNQILADDWEIEEKKVEITEAQLELAYQKAWEDDRMDPSFINKLKERLGF